jgi:3-phenylpropionate/trans-cinnamate dioxygenase ferredoxin reductase subunit
VFVVRLDGIVIIGSGETGTRAAIALRQNGWAGALTLIGDELHLPYERPPLSKSALTCDAEPPPPAITDCGQLSELGVERRVGVHVTAVDRLGHKISTREHGDLPYGRLLLATGARARRLSVEGGEHALILRSYDDALILRQRLKPSARVVIIGGGFIGMELAASARERGCSVVLLEVAPRVLGRGVPEDIADIVAARHSAAGVEILVSSGIARIGRTGADLLVELTDGRAIVADSIIAGVGAEPNTALGQAARLLMDNGIAVDGKLCTSDPDIFAAGDCCSFPNALYGGRRLRLESWRNARDQGNFAARSMLGAVEDYAELPWFWSDQYDLHLQITGLIYAGIATVTREYNSGERLNFHLAEDGRVVAASAVGPMSKIGKDARLAEMLIRKGVIPSHADLASPEYNLKALLNKK